MVEIRRVERPVRSELDLGDVLEPGADRRLLPGAVDADQRARGTIDEVEAGAEAPPGPTAIAPPPTPMPVT